MIAGKERIVTRHDYQRIQEYIRDRDVHQERARDGLLGLRRFFPGLKLVDSRKIPANVITINSIFSLTNIGNGARTVCKLVFSDEAISDEADEAEIISVFSPMGSEVLGHRVGSVVKGSGNAADRYFMIDRILYQPESAGRIPAGNGSFVRIPV